MGTALPVRYFKHDGELDAIAQAENLDCLLPSFRALSIGVQTPWIGYIYDFQHRYLPHLFTEAERAARDANFRSMAKHARHVIVNSRNVQKDCVSFLGSSGASFIALPFGASPNPDWLTAQPALLPKYDLPRRYFLVSNQFWTHKNHRIVFEALQILAKTTDYDDVGVVCTGSTVDERDRDYFPSLLRFLGENKLTDRVRILDYIPKRDQIEIMKYAISVVQPTLFEGGPGGGAVYDAVSVGVPALVSDIPVNRELESRDYQVQFFDPMNAAALAELMLKQAQQKQSQHSAPGTLIENGLRRRAAVGKTIEATIEAARAAHTSS
jgi:glycosyltransferase involved in cell wall biosynthesis